MTSRKLLVFYDSVLKFSNGIDNFIKFPQNGNFSHFSIDFPTQYCPEKVILMQSVWSWYLIKRFSEWWSFLSTPGV